MGKQQTAVEYLVHIVQCCIAPNYIPIEIVKQAKEMEKKQITTAYLTGIMHPLEMEATMQSEQYYNETYRK